MENKKLFGFTLAECMIAIAIVGVVAALTVPGVVANYQKHTYITSLKKAYTDLQQNLTVLQAENYRNKGLYKTVLHKQDGKTVEETAGKFLTEYYQISKDCKTDTQPCFAPAYGSINGDTDTNFSCNGYSVLLKNDVAMCMIPAIITYIEKFSPTGNKIITVKHPVTVYIDTNGPELPNIGGRDMFTFNIYEDFSIDIISPDTIQNSDAQSERNTLFNDDCKTSYIGEGCFGKILNDNWNMNY